MLRGAETLHPGEPGPRSAGPGKDGEEQGTPWLTPGTPHRLRPSRTRLGPKGALLTCMLRQQVRIQTPGHAGSQATSSLPVPGTLITGVPGSQLLPIPPIPGPVSLNQLSTWGRGSA